MGYLRVKAAGILVISNDPDYCRAPKDIVPDNI